jgi:hypothetical protein
VLFEIYDLGGYGYSGLNAQSKLNVDEKSLYAKVV